MPIIDVRDVALAHIKAIMMPSQTNKNGRYLLSTESLWFSEIINCLKDEEKKLGAKIKTKVLGNFTLSIAKWINPEIKHILPFVNQELRIDGT